MAGKGRNHPYPIATSPGTSPQSRPEHLLHTGRAFSAILERLRGRFVGGEGRRRAAFCFPGMSSPRKAGLDC